MSEFILRTFVCKHCGHEVVVNPKLPPNYTPNVCTPCFDAFERPRHEKAMRNAFRGIEQLYAALKDARNAGGQ